MIVLSSSSFSLRALSYKPPISLFRPNMSLNYRTPVALPELEVIATMQGKWTKILSLVA